jgi:tetratricopeptide (TPR) repeat protein
MNRNFHIRITITLNSIQTPKTKPCQNLGAKMPFNPPSDDDDLWNEFNDPETPMARKAAILYELGHKEMWNFTSRDPLKYWLPGLEIAREHQLIRQWIEFAEVITREYIKGKIDYQKALEMADEGLGLIPEFSLDVEDRNSQAHLTWGKAVAYDNLEQFEKALTYFTIAFQMYSDVGNEFLSNIIKSAAINAHIELDEYADAEQMLVDNREFFLDKEDLGRVAYCDLLTVMILVHKGQYQEAIALALEVKSVEKQINKLDPDTLRWVAKAYFYVQEYDKAIDHYRQAIKLASKKHERDLSELIKANLGLAEVFDAQGNKDEAAVARFDAEAVKSRVKKPKLNDSSKLLQKVQKHRSEGEYELALQITAEIIQYSSEVGNISLHLRGKCERLVTLFEQDDYEGVVNTWEHIPRAALELSDELVIKIKNMVCHCLAKLGRAQEAADLSDQVFSDIRLEQDKQEQAYAFENRVEIESDPNEKSKHISYAIERNLEAQNPGRALKITRKFRKKY